MNNPKRIKPNRKFRGVEAPLNPIGTYRNNKTPLMAGQNNDALQFYSLFDPLLNKMGRRRLSRQTGITNPLELTMKGYSELFAKNTLEYFENPGQAFMNNLRLIGDTLDMATGPVKAQYYARANNISYEEAMNRFYGTGNKGRIQYDFSDIIKKSSGRDIGLVEELFYEILADPFNWVTFGASAMGKSVVKGATKTTLTGIAEGLIKTGGDDALSQVDTIVKRLGRLVLDKDLKGFEDVITKADRFQTYMKADIEDLFAKASTEVKGNIAYSVLRGIEKVEDTLINITFPIKNLWGNKIVKEFFQSSASKLDDAILKERLSIKEEIAKFDEAMKDAEDMAKKVEDLDADDIEKKIAVQIHEIQKARQAGKPLGDLVEEFYKLDAMRSFIKAGDNKAYGEFYQLLNKLRIHLKYPGRYKKRSFNEKVQRLMHEHYEFIDDPFEIDEEEVADKLFEFFVENPHMTNVLAMKDNADIKSFMKKKGQEHVDKLKKQLEAMQQEYVDAIRYGDVPEHMWDLDKIESIETKELDLRKVLKNVYDTTYLKDTTKLKDQVDIEQDLLDRANALIEAIDFKEIGKEPDILMSQVILPLTRHLADYPTVIEKNPSLAKLFHMFGYRNGRLTGLRNIASHIKRDPNLHILEQSNNIMMKGQLAELRSATEHKFRSTQEFQEAVLRSIDKAFDLVKQTKTAKKQNYYKKRTELFELISPKQGRKSEFDFLLEGEDLKTVESMSTRLHIIELKLQTWAEFIVNPNNPFPRTTATLEYYKNIFVKLNRDIRGDYTRVLENINELEVIIKDPITRSQTIKADLRDIQNQIDDLTKHYNGIWVDDRVGSTFKKSKYIKQKRIADKVRELVTQKEAMEARLKDLEESLPQRIERLQRDIEAFSHKQDIDAVVEMTKEAKTMENVITDEMVEDIIGAEASQIMTNREAIEFVAKVNAFTAVDAEYDQFLKYYRPPRAVRDGDRVYEQFKTPIDRLWDVLKWYKNNEGKFNTMVKRITATNLFQEVQIQNMLDWNEEMTRMIRGLFAPTNIEVNQRHIDFFSQNFRDLNEYTKLGTHLTGIQSEMLIGVTQGKSLEQISDEILDKINDLFKKARNAVEDPGVYVDEGGKFVKKVHIRDNRLANASRKFRPLTFESWEQKATYNEAFYDIADLPAIKYGVNSDNEYLKELPEQLDIIFRKIEQRLEEVVDTVEVDGMFPHAVTTRYVSSENEDLFRLYLELDEFRTTVSKGEVSMKDLEDFLNEIGPDEFTEQTLIERIKYFNEDVVYEDLDELQDVIDNLVRERDRIIYQHTGSNIVGLAQSQVNRYKAQLIIMDEVLNNDGILFLEDVFNGTYKSADEIMWRSPVTNTNVTERIDKETRDIINRFFNNMGVMAGAEFKELRQTVLNALEDIRAFAEFVDEISDSGNLSETLAFANRVGWLVKNRDITVDNFTEMTLKEFKDIELDDTLKNRVLQFYFQGLEQGRVFDIDARHLSNKINYHMSRLIKDPLRFTKHADHVKQMDIPDGGSIEHILTDQVKEGLEHFQQQMADHLRAPLRVIKEENANAKYVNIEKVREANLYESRVNAGDVDYTIKHMDGTKANQNELRKYYKIFEGVEGMEIPEAKFATGMLKVDKHPMAQNFKKLAEVLELPEQIVLDSIYGKRHKTVNRLALVREWEFRIEAARARAGDPLVDKYIQQLEAIQKYAEYWGMKTGQEEVYDRIMAGMMDSLNLYPPKWHKDLPFDVFDAPANEVAEYVSKVFTTKNAMKIMSGSLDDIIRYGGGVEGAFKYINSHPEMKMVAISNTDKYKGMKITPINISSPDEMARLQQSDLVIGIADDHQIKEIKKLIRHKDELPPELKQAKKMLVDWLKVPALANAGFTINNLIDISIKNFSNSKNPIQSVRNMVRSANMIGTWQKAYAMADVALRPHFKEIGSRIEYVWFDEYLKRFGADGFTSKEIQTIKLVQEFRNTAAAASESQQLVAKAGKETIDGKSIIGSNKYKSDLENTINTYLFAKGPLATNLKINSHLELVGRLGMYIDEIESGVLKNEALNKVLRTHFNYSDKSMAELYLEFIIPFNTYFTRSFIYWANALTDPKVGKTAVDVLKLAWEDELEESEYNAYRMMRGGIPLPGTDISLDAGLSFADAMALPGTLGSTLGRKTNPMLRALMSHMGATRDTNNLSQKIPVVSTFLPNSKYSTKNHLSRVPIASHLSVGAKNISALANNQQLTMDKFAPSLFSQTYNAWEYKQGYRTKNYNFYNRLMTKNGTSRAQLRALPINTSNARHKSTDAMWMFRR